MNFRGNLYTFGCSMTSYAYPTWADILGKEFSKFENWGKSSAGNAFIYNSIIECLTRNTISDDDTFIIMWSGITRTDFYHTNQWNCIHDLDLVNPSNCPDGFEIINYGYFSGIEKLLNAAGINFIMLCWSDYDCNSRAGQLYKSTIEKIININYKPTSKKILRYAEHDIKKLYDKLSGSDWPTFDNVFSYNSADYSHEINHEVKSFIDEVFTNKNLYFTENVIDLHPTPIEHLKIIKNTFKNIKLSQSTIDWVNTINEKLLKGIPFEFNKSLPERL